MAKRIVEETLANGEKRFSVQKNTILGIPAWWHTMEYLDDDNACVKDLMSKDKLAEDELIDLRGALTLLCNRYEKRIRVEEYKAVEVVRRFIDRMLGV